MKNHQINQIAYNVIRYVANPEKTSNETFRGVILGLTLALDGKVCNSVRDAVNDKIRLLETTRKQMAKRKEKE